MKMLKKLMVFFSGVLLIASVAVMPAEAQKGKNYVVKTQHQFDDLATPMCEVDDVAVGSPQAKTKQATLIKYTTALPRVDQARSTDWPLNGLDLANSRYSTLDQINLSNIDSVRVVWMQQITAGGRADFGPRHETIPVVVNGIMYVTDMPANVYALNAKTGQRIWQFTLPDVSRISRVTNRGVCYGDGKIYVGAGGRLFALDAVTGEPVESFGGGDGIPVVFRSVKRRFPNVTVDTTASIGYDNTIAPQYYNGMVFITFNHSESNVPGGLIVALDATTGEQLWEFNGVPQGPEDEGWDIAKDTWVGGVRNGGGIWNTPAIDPELGLLYVNVTNPTPDLDGSGRKGINLFSNCTVALDVATGELKWYYQHVHHDIWDYDSSAPNILFDVQVNGRTVKALAHPQKNGYVYILNRANGVPINPIYEIAVDTVSSVPGEEVFPTQPIPYTRFGVPQEPFVPIFPPVENRDIEPEIYSRIGVDIFLVPFYTPPSFTELTIFSPEGRGGALYSQSSHSPRTRLLYVSGIDRITARKAASVGATLQPGQGSFGGAAAVRPGPAHERGTLSAYDPATGQQVWQAHLPGQAQAGSLATAGDLVFQGTGYGILHGFNAATGEEVFSFNTGNRIQAAPMTYELNGKQYITVAAGDVILTFALP